MRKISVSVDSLGRVTADSKLLGYSGEHNAVTLAVDLSSGQNDGFLAAEYCRVVVEGFYSDEIYVTDGGFEYTVPGECMFPPKVHCQIVGYQTENGEPNVIVKSEVFGFEVERSEVPVEAVSGEAGVFERTLEKCSALAKTAVASADLAKASCEDAGDSAQAATAAMQSALSSATAAEKSAETAVSAAEVLSDTAINIQNLANALKGSASGTVVAIKDVSPLPHDVTVKASGEAVGGEETLTKTVEVTEAMQTVSLDTPASSVRVVVSGGAYCVGGLVPTVSGDDLTVSGVREQIALWPTWSYSEAPGNYDVVYTISGNTLLWSGTKYYVFDGVIEGSETVSGSFELSTSGQTITGFCQVYGLDEDNPYAEHPEWDELTMTVEVYEGLSNVNVKVCGKNLFNAQAAVANSSYPSKVGYDAENDVIYTNFINGSIHFNNSSSKAINYPAGTYTITVVPVSEKVSMAIYPYAKGTTTTLGTIRAIEITKPYSATITTTEPFYLGVGGLYHIEEKYYGEYYYKIQLEQGTGTEYEPYKEPVTYAVGGDGETTVPSQYPSMTFIPDTEGVTLSVEYNRDINKAFAELQAALISMGGNI